MKLAQGMQSGCRLEIAKIKLRKIKNRELPHSSHGVSRGGALEQHLYCKTTARRCDRGQLSSLAMWNPFTTMADHLQIDFSIAPWFLVIEFTPVYLKILFALYLYLPNLGRPAP